MEGAKCSQYQSGLFRDAQHPMIVKKTLKTLYYLMLFTNQTESSIQEHAWGRKKDTYITRATSNRELIVVDKCTHRL